MEIGNLDDIKRYSTSFKDNKDNYNSIGSMIYLYTSNRILRSTINESINKELVLFTFHVNNMLIRK